MQAFPIQQKIATVSKDDDGMRIDRYCSKYLKTPVVLIIKLLRKKKILVNGSTAPINKRVSEGEVIEILQNPTDTLYEERKRGPTKTINPVQQKKLTNILSNFEKLVLYENDHIIAINKPPGIAVQGGTKIRESIADILPLMDKSRGTEIKIVHRLDKPVSGVLLLGKSNVATRKIADMLKSRSIIKKYIAVVYGRIEKDSGILNFPIQKKDQTNTNHLNHLKIWAHEIARKNPNQAHEAETRYKVLAKNHQISVLELQPITGKTHQIRIHISLLGYPVIGDLKYSNSAQQNKCQKQQVVSAKLRCYQKSLDKMVDIIYLHAYSIQLDLFDQKVFIKAELPQYFQQILLENNFEKVLSDLK